MKNKLVRTIDRINEFMGYFTGFSIFVLLILATWGVFSRYVLRRPSHIALEISGYLMVALTFFGSGYILLKAKHVSVQVLTARLKGSAKRFHDLTVNILLFIFTALVIYEGFGFTLLAYREHYRSTSLLNFPMWIVYLTIPVGMIFLLLQIIRNIIVLTTGETLDE